MNESDPPTRPLRTETEVFAGKPDCDQPARLVVLGGQSALTVHTIVADEVRIGRDAGNDLVLRSQVVSRHHAAVLRSEGGYFIEDRGSKGGVRVNGRKLVSGERYRLRHGDRLALADAQMLFVQCESLDEVQQFATIHLDRTRIAAEADDFVRDLDAPEPGA
jgi:pSer/pThr/pTyr-binding forkhead associated (FHA) protein